MTGRATASSMMSPTAIMRMGSGPVSESSAFEEAELISMTIATNNAIANDVTLFGTGFRKVPSMQ
jgi:hypothetical protein